MHIAMHDTKDTVDANKLLHAVATASDGDGDGALPTRYIFYDGRYYANPTSLLADHTAAPPPCLLV